MNEIFEHSNESMTRELTRDFFKKVYGYMFMALMISGAVSYYIGVSPEVFASIFINETTGKLSPMFYVIMFAPVGLGLLIQMKYRSFSIPVLTFMFIAYAALIGLSLSYIFLIYSAATIASAFFVAAGAFAGMAILGYTTKTDLTKFGSLLYMVFIGMFIAAIVNLFIQNDMMGFIISVIGVFVFTGLTAYWMQQLKNIAGDSMIDGVDRQKLALVGGLNLYILFINLFLSLLRIFGSRD